MGEPASVKSTKKSLSIGFVELAVTVVIASVMIFLLWPAVVNDRTGPRRMKMANQLKQVALAMHNYHDTYKKLPPAYEVDDQGKRTNSWRIRLLPFLEQEPAHEQFNKGDSLSKAQRDQLRSDLASLFHNPDDKFSPKEHTSIMVITGPGTMFEEGRDTTLADCKDGMFNTILAVEVKKSGVNWDEPIDLDIRTMVMKINASDGQGLGNFKNRDACVAFVDGSTRFLSSDVLETTLRAMITRAGGEKFDLP